MLNLSGSKIKFDSARIMSDDGWGGVVFDMLFLDWDWGRSNRIEREKKMLCCFECIHSDFRGIRTHNDVQHGNVTFATQIQY